MLLRRLARPLLAATFIHGGIAAWRDPKGRAEHAAPMLDRITGIVPIGEPPSALTLVQVDAGVKVGAGLLLALGRMPRLSAAALAAGLVPTTVAGHRFWEIDDPSQRANQQIHFVKNLSLLGGLLVAAGDTHGKPSLAWRARRTGAASAELNRNLSSGLGQLSGRAEQLAGAASRAGDRLAPVAARAGDRLSERAESLFGEADVATSRAVKRARKAGRKARKRAEKRVALASKELDRAGRRASKQLTRMSKRTSKQSARQLKQASAKAREARAIMDAKRA